jgi:hypothetical protein
MSKKRGLNVDEKKARVLEIFAESVDFSFIDSDYQRDVFTLKQLETSVPKKGVGMERCRWFFSSLSWNG